MSKTGGHGFKVRGAKLEGDVHGNFIYTEISWCLEHTGRGGGVARRDSSIYSEWLLGRHNGMQEMEAHGLCADRGDLFIWASCSAWTLWPVHCSMFHLVFPVCVL